jgi:hypothetical protein
MSIIGSMSTRNPGHCRRDIRVAPLGQNDHRVLDFECIAVNTGALSLRIGPSQNGMNVPILPMAVGNLPYRVFDLGPANMPYPAAMQIQPLLWPNIHYALDYDYNYTIEMTDGHLWFRYESLNPNNNRPPQFYKFVELRIQVQHVTLGR